MTKKTKNIGEGYIEIHPDADRYARFEVFRSFTEDLKMTNEEAQRILAMSHTELGKLMDEFRPILDSNDDPIRSS